MFDEWGTREELIAEIKELRERVRRYEAGTSEGASIGDAIHAAIERSHMMETVVNSIPDGVMIYDINEQPIIFNATAKGIYRVLGLPDDDMVGSGTCCLYQENGSRMPCEEAPLRRTLKRGEVLHDLIFSTRPDQDPVLYYSVSSAPIRTARGDVIGAVMLIRDITLRREHERTIAFQASLLESVHDAITVTDGSGRVLYWNRMAEDMFGWSAREMVGKTSILLADQPAQARKRAYARLMRVGYYTGEMVFRCKDGRRIETDVHIRVLKGNQGEYKGQVASFRDITTQKQALSALRESEAQYRELVKHAPVGIYEVDYRTQQFRTVNDAMCLVTGYSRDELLSMNVGNLLTPECQVLLQQRMALWLGGIQPDTDVDYQVLTKDGRLIDVELHVTFTRNPDGTPRGATAVCYDITERKRIEDMLRASEERSRLLLSTIALAVWDADTEGRLTDARYWQAFTGQSDAECSGFGWIDAIHPDDRARVQGEVLTGIREGRLVNVDYRLWSRSGEWVWTNSLATPLRDKNGHIDKWIGMNIDISTRKALEDSLRQKVEELVTASHNKNLFLNTLSHELRNPLAAIVSSLDLLAFARDQRDEARTNRVIDILRRQTGQLTKLVDDLLDVTRITTNKIRLRKEPIDLIGLVQRSIADILPQYTGKGVALQAALADEPIMLKADPVRLTQVVGNLLHNALKFTGSGGEVQVTTCLDKDREHVQVSVVDSGSGIEPDILPYIFEPFSQGEQTLARSQGGLGLGLSIVKGIVELHGGSVVAESGGPGRGTRITIQLPLPSQAGKSGEADTAP